MPLWQNLPFAMILLPLFSASVTSVLPRRAARRTALAVLALVGAMALLFLIRMSAFGRSYTYMMGHFPAPWGNEIRGGLLEACLALCFSLVMGCSVAGGLRSMDRDIPSHRQTLFFVMCELTLSALMAEVFTNDVFTGYVFLEIMTIAACSLICARDTGRALTAAVRYMIMNLIGSGLFLLSLTLLYDLTGHLLMSNVRERMADLLASGRYHQPITVILALTTIGLGVKSSLFPFHTWVPDAYSFSTPTASAVLSSLVSKGYIFLLFKFYDRVFGLDALFHTGVADILFLFGAAGAILGSVLAVRQLEIGRMIAYSSVAQIGYIFMAMGLGTQEGLLAAIFQLIAHSVCKSLLFLSAGGLCDASAGHHTFQALRGSFYRHPVAGAAFIVGALSMIGFPFFSGFIVKLTYGAAAVHWGGHRMIIVLLVLAVSTLLNALYFGRTLITLFRLREDQIASQPRTRGGWCFNASCAALSAVTVALGVFSAPVLSALRRGLEMFG